VIRTAARFAARFLPASAKAAIARRRFGEAAAIGDVSFEVERRTDGDTTAYAIDRRLRLRAGPAGADAIEYSFVRNPDSRTEMAAFIRESTALAPGALLLDVGAHVGLFTAVHLSVRPEHRAVMFEPSPLLSGESAAWLRMNGFDGRGEARCAGVGDRVEERLVSVDALGFARQAADGGAPDVAVPFTTIDHVCRTEGLTPALVKIDVEGHEAEVLRGARETLHRLRPILFLELHLDMLEQKREPLPALLAGLVSAGYGFESTRGDRMSANRIARSLKAILRIVGRPREVRS